MDKRKLDLFLEAVERSYQEAVIRTQISPDARREVEKSREGHKKLGSQRLALLRQVVTKEFHTMSPEDKKKIVAQLGFDGKEVETSGGDYTIISHSEINPDTLFGTANGIHTKTKIKPAGETFIYDINKGKTIASLSDPTKQHFVVSNRFKLYGAFRDNPRYVHGRVVKLEEPFYNEFWETDVDKGSHLAIWTDTDKDAIDDIISELPEHLKPDYVHVPGKVRGM